MRLRALWTMIRIAIAVRGSRRNGSAMALQHVNSYQQCTNEISRKIFETGMSGFEMGIAMREV
jgi:hypothetical protein